MNKKGFTLIEIIIVILLLAVVGTGTTLAVIKLNHKKEHNILIENENIFKNAIDVYLSNHSEVVNNINNNAEGSVISLELLKNEGLISNNLKINYEDNYYVLSNALLSNKAPSDLDGECKDSVGLNIIASWQKKNDSSEVLYFCPKKTIVSSNEIIDPKKACEDGVLQADTLTCQIIKNAKNAPDDYADEISELIEDETQGIGTKITNIGERTYLTGMPEGEPKYKIISDTTELKTLIFKNAYCEFSGYTYIYDEKDLVFDSNTGIFRVIDGAIPKKTWKERTGCYEYYFGTEYSNIGDYASLVNDISTYLADEDKVLVVKDFENEDIKRIYKSIRCVEDDGYSCNGEKVKNANSNYIAEYQQGEIIMEKSLRKTDDDYGVSYYFRGNVDDNYVTFNNMCWRIMRIQGDGSVKLVLSSPNGPCNEKNHNDTSGIVTELGAWGRGLNDFYCESGKSGSSSCFVYHYNHSPMNINLKDWLINRIKLPELDLLKKETFCIGQSDNEVNIVYDKIDSDYKPSLICDSMGGARTTYAEEISLVTLEEMIYAGVAKKDILVYGFDVDAQIGDITTYLRDNAKADWVLLTPSMYGGGDKGWVFAVRKNTRSFSEMPRSALYSTDYRNGYAIRTKGSTTSINGIGATRPVIVLKPENYVDVSKKVNGTLEKPYEIIIKS